MSHATGQVDFDAPCMHCGYNLRGLSPEATCPECASPVGDSLRGDQLRFASPVYLRKLVRGASLVWWSGLLILVGIIGGLAMMVLALALASSAAAMVMGWAMSLLFITAPVLGLVGWWLLSTPDPAAGGEVRRGATSRVVLRSSLAVLIVSIGIVVVGRSTNTPAAPSPGVPNAQDVMSMVLIAAWWTAAAAGVVHLAAATLYARYLAARIPDPRLVASATSLLRSGGAMIALVTALAIAMALLSKQALAGVSGCFNLIGAAIVITLYFSIVGRLRHAMMNIPAQDRA